MALRVVRSTSATSSTVSNGGSAVDLAAGTAGLARLSGTFEIRSLRRRPRPNAPLVNFLRALPRRSGVTLRSRTDLLIDPLPRKHIYYRIHPHISALAVNTRWTYRYSHAP